MSGDSPIDARTFARERSPRFGSRNPMRMDYAFWLHMVRTGQSAYQARQTFDPGGDIFAYGPVWCFERFGQTRTAVPDGRVICIGGEHEDHYDPDFCIYNDVIVVGPNATGDELAIYGYPKSVFPPTDFHTATLWNDGIFIVGGLGYLGERGGADTPVYRLDLRTYAITRLPASGASPGWIYRHRAQLVDGGRALRVWGGMVLRREGNRETMVEHQGAADLLLRSLTWQPADMPADAHAAPVVKWPADWEPVTRSSEVSSVMYDLRRQVPPRHPLFALEVRPWARRTAGNAALLKMLDGTDRLAEVSLSPSESRAILPEPVTVFYDDLPAWLRATGVKQSNAE